MRDRFPGAHAQLERTPIDAHANRQYVERIDSLHITELLATANRLAGGRVDPSCPATA